MVFLKNSKEKRDVILRTALQLISERGLHDTPMSLLAKTSGVATGTIYHHFKGKEAIINALYKEIKIFMFEEVLQGFSPQMPVREGFFVVLRNYLSFKLTYTTEMRFMEQYKNSPYIQQETLDELAALDKPFAQLFERGKAEGEIGDYEMPVIVAMAVGPIDFIMHSCHWLGAELSSEIIDQTVKCCWRAIAAQGKA